MPGNGHNGFKYPYSAISPVDGINKEFNSYDDVEKELLRCYDECIQKNLNNIGETLYIEHFFFCNTSELLNRDMQMIVKKYNYCKTFNCPPYPSLDDTPANIFEDFMIIDQEVSSNRSKGNNGNK